MAETGAPLRARSWRWWLAGVAASLVVLIGVLAGAGVFSFGRNSTPPTNSDDRSSRAVAEPRWPGSGEKAAGTDPFEFDAPASQVAAESAVHRSAAGTADRPNPLRDALAVPKDERLVSAVSVGNRLLQEGKTAEAIEQFKLAMKLNPQSEDTHFNLGIALAKQGDLDAAVAQYTEALRLMPDYAEAHNNLGNVLVRQGKFADAISEFQAAIKSMPEHAGAHNNLGSVLGRAGRIKEAIAEFAEAVRLRPDYVEARFNLGNAYLSQKRFAEAEVELHEALRLRPGFAPAQQALARLAQVRNVAGPQSLGPVQNP